jgi:uncharacterized protein YecE (DUF72 family)
LGTGFSDEELREWADRLWDFQRAGVDAYIYFNNDPEGHALRDAERLCGLLAEKGDGGA